MAIVGSIIAANIGTILTAAAAQTAFWTTFAAVQQQNAQLEYQKKVLEQDKIAAQNKAAAEMKLRATEAARQNAAARTKMAASGVSSTTGSFLDLIGQGAAAGEMDVLKAKHDGDVEAWVLNNKINELESQKQNAFTSGILSATSAGISSAINLGVGSGGAGSTSGISWGKVASGEKIGTDASSKIYAPLSSGLS